MDPKTCLKYTEFLALKQMGSQLVSTFDFDIQEGSCKDGDFDLVLKTYKHFIKILIRVNTNTSNLKKTLQQQRLPQATNQQQQPNYIEQQFTQMENN